MFLKFPLSLASFLYEIILSSFCLSLNHLFFIYFKILIYDLNLIFKQILLAIHWKLRLNNPDSLLQAVLFGPVIRVLGVCNLFISFVSEIVY